MMKKKNFPADIEPCCELCEYAVRMEATGELFCKYKCTLRKVEESDVCKKFSFNIFACQPKVPNLPHYFDFTKL